MHVNPAQHPRREYRPRHFRSAPIRRANSRAPTGIPRAGTRRLAPPRARGWIELPSFTRAPADNAATPLPANLHGLAVLHQNRHGALPTTRVAHTLQSLRVSVYVVLFEIAPVPFEPFTHVTGKRTA